MAINNDKPHTPPLTTIPLDEHGVIWLNLEAKPLAIHDTITEHLGQLMAMLALVYGDKPCPLNQLNDDLQNHYLWAMTRHIQMIERLFNTLTLPNQ